MLNYKIFFLINLNIYFLDKKFVKIDRFFLVFLDFLRLKQNLTRKNETKLKKNISHNGLIYRHLYEINFAQFYFFANAFAKK